MHRIGYRAISVAAITSMFVATSWAVAFAVVYDDTCNASGDACMWKNGPFVVPLAAATVSDHTYTNEDWPNTTQTLNDSASSLRNKFDVKDVVWFKDADYSGLSICVDHETGVSTLGVNLNDELTAHAISVGSTC
jgi:hypothetical protein